MNQIKIGGFLKELRKEKGLTQEQLAEKFNVARRTVSRWETGSNLPDLDILIEMSDYYNIELRELLDGERKREKMDKDLEETVLKVAEYSNEDKLKVTRRMHKIFIAGLISAVAYVVLGLLDCENNFFGGLLLGITISMPILGIIMTSKYANKIRAYKMKFLNRK